MAFELFIAKRYIWSKRRHPFVGVVSFISVLGIAVGVFALISVLSVMNGFDDELKDRIIGMRAHLVVEKDGTFAEPEKVLDRIQRFQSVAGASPYIEGQALFQVNEWGTGVVIRGIDLKLERSVSQFFRYLKQGVLSDSPDGIAIGIELAKRAGLRVGSKVLIATQYTKKPVPFRVEGIFSSGMYEYDANLAFVNLANAQRLYAMPDQITGISVYLKNSEQAQPVREALQRALGYPFLARSWMDMNRALFSALKLEKVVMFLIVALIILVASLNIAGSLTIMVIDKTKDIGILRAIGATRASLMKIFAFDGLILGLAGAGSGLSAGLAFCWALKRYSFIDLPREIYFDSRLPVRIDWVDTGLVVAVAVLMSLVASFYPSWTAGRLDPVKALRYE